MLPIEAVIPDIISTLASDSRLVLQAEPGAGKSTLVPLRLLQTGLFGDKKIIMLEPRRVAAKSIAHYLAKQLGETVGERVGYQIRNEKRLSAKTRLEIVTEGVLTRRLQADPELVDVGLIIFDEFHERSIHADLALMLAYEVQQAYRDDLKLLVMSATIDTALLSRYLDDAPILTCPGKTYPVDVAYFGKPSQYLSDHVLRALQQVLRVQESGDILVFLPGQGEIVRCIEACKATLGEDIICLPLYGGLPLAEQEKVLSKQSAAVRRVIFATNIAETSLTIEGITGVIDSGLEKRLTYDVKSGLSRLDTVMISKASATQRAGRAGRLQPGYCLRLWQESAHNTLGDFQPEEITTTDLCSLALELSAWGITQYQDANWLSAPPERHFTVARQLNHALNLVDEQNKILTAGQMALALGVAPRLASMLLQSSTLQEQQIACLLAAMLSERDIQIQAKNSDIARRLLALVEYSKDKKAATSAYRLHRATTEVVLTLAKSFAKKLGIVLNIERLSLTDIHNHTASLLLHAFVDRAAQKRAHGDNRYLLANGRGVTLREADTLQGEEYLVVCDVDGKNKDGLVYLACAVSQSLLLEQLASQLSEETHYQLDNKKEAILGRRRLCYQALILKEQNLSQIPACEFESCVKDILTSQGLGLLNWSAKSQAWLARAKWLGEHVDEFPCISEAHLIAQLDTWLLPYLSGVNTIKQLKQLDIFNLLQATLTWDQQQQLASQAPEFYITPSEKRVLIRYDEHQGPTVSVVLQEMFGQLESPMLAGGKVAVRFELLSPAKRPIQTTSDLGNFWRTSYFDVAKEMRGRYPKHRWPDKPLEEKPGRSIKPKSH
ncbi:ATP-dependent helicase HrpB [Pseudoalteromonas peptidolytica]|uniref:ATP-dependent helicase HrpB n=1 Tax=Pseudoalteromonas peptidolytica F12-50-A1 TaxID=1315280 RepID=A0A8I0T596_9GAMM|nr:ATP-dependent helicase HrpB [Pseudoalteromonas peptidolytica]MBE0346998.1 ATP-dependent helicase HrpB [Pseudoalteromonas peptidolytica F12-50-A1]NLR14051.1 ATP-dependent helicase HrpB [Pseudoalteromonas peptidolytica]GEK11004.1 ATP-dependent helicase HrpB [Pseudoalteromonas peptidolytica]